MPAGETNADTKTDTNTDYLLTIAHAHAHADSNSDANADADADADNNHADSNHARGRLVTHSPRFNQRERSVFDGPDVLSESDTGPLR